MRTEIFGVGFDDIGLEAAVTEGLSRIGGKACAYVVTPNPELVSLARHDPDYRDILNRAALVLPDGIGILHAARILGRPIRKGRLPGIDFAEALLPRLAEQGIPLFLLGAKPGVAREAGERLAAAYPGLLICGVADGYFQDPSAAAAAIRTAGAKVVFVCLGAPKQERFMADYGKESGASLMIGLGGALDVFSGRSKRAPLPFQRLGLEWFYRLLCEPSRIGRMAKLPGFLVLALFTRAKGG